MAASYRNFVAGPCIGGFVRAFYKRPAEVDLFTQQPWKVASAYGRSPGRPVSVAGLAARYGCAEEELWDLDQLVAGARPFQFLEHPVIAKLGDADYN